MKPFPLRIAPSILAADFGMLAAQVKAAEQAGADLIHCDVMDGHFVPNLTFGPGVVAALREAARLPLDVHLMILQPELSMKVYAAAGANIITVHQETCPHLHRTLMEIRRLGAQAGVALNPSTPVALIEPVVEQMDLLLIMTVSPGFGGQPFIEACLRKIEAARALREKMRMNFSIEVDGGIDATTAPRVIAAGADTLVAGTAIFAGSIADNIRTLRQAAC
jgi:ribulose-phosphate 3-epimerase